MKIKDFNIFYFDFRHFFLGLTPLKLENFDKKLIISNNTQNFAQRSYRESIINRPLHHIKKIKFFNFLWISSLFSWANTFKTQEFRPKIDNFQQHSKFSTNLILKKHN